MHSVASVGTGGPVAAAVANFFQRARAPHEVDLGQVHLVPVAHRDVGAAPHDCDLCVCVCMERCGAWLLVRTMGR